MVEQRDKLKNLCAPSRSAYRTCYESRAQRRDMSRTWSNQQLSQLESPEPAIPHWQ